MRKIEEQMLNAIKTRKNFRCGNVQVAVTENIDIYLHDQRIGALSDNFLWLRDCGKQTPVTKSRLNALLTLLPKLTELKSVKGKWTLTSTAFEDQPWTKHYWYELSLKDASITL